MMVLALGIFVILGYPGDGLGIEMDQKTEKIEKIEIDRTATECGGLEFDKKTGGMKRKPNVDLIVTKIEIIRNDSGVWVIPWIKNRCSGTISKDIHVLVGDVVVTFAGIPPKVSTSLGHAVGQPSATSYTVIVDYDHRIAEADESNNRCTKSVTGNCP
jgi:hypothetical protein